MVDVTNIAVSYCSWNASGLKSNIHITHHRGFSVLYSMGWIHYIMFPYFHFIFFMAIYRAELLYTVIKDICQSLKIGLFSLLLPKLNILDKSLPVAWKDISYVYICFQAIKYLLPDSYKREPYTRKSNGMHSHCFIRKLTTLPTFLKADTNQAALGNVL